LKSFFFVFFVYKMLFYKQFFVSGPPPPRVENVPVRAVPAAVVFPPVIGLEPNFARILDEINVLQQAENASDDDEDDDDDDDGVR
jgi:hypothetical protein